MENESFVISWQDKDYEIALLVAVFWNNLLFSSSTIFQNLMNVKSLRSFLKWNHRIFKKSTQTEVRLIIKLKLFITINLQMETSQWQCSVTSTTTDFFLKSLGENLRQVWRRQCKNWPSEQEISDHCAENDSKAQPSVVSHEDQHEHQRKRHLYQMEKTLIEMHHWEHRWSKTEQITGISLETSKSKRAKINWVQVSCN